MTNKKLIEITHHGQFDVKEISSLFGLCMGKKMTIPSNKQIKTIKSVLLKSVPHMTK